MGPATTPTDWAAHYPHYAVGDSSKASVEKGKKIMEAWMDTVVDVILKVNQDEVVGRIMATLIERRLQPGGDGKR